MPASAEPRTLVVRGTNTVSFADVLVGEVWFCSGQSNMEKQIGPRKGHPEATDNYEAEIKNAHHPLLRLFQVPHHGEPAPDVLGLRWVACTPDTLVATQFSAVGYYFGRERNRTLGVPVGLIHSSFGASQIEAWLPEEAFEKTPALSKLRHVAYPAWDKGMQATELYQSMVAPFAPFSLRGFLWYQGEANAIQTDDGIYTEKMRALVESWREAWGDSAAPWYYVQIAPYRYSSITSYGTRPTPEALPVFWEAQAAAQSIPRTGMVVTTDLAAGGRNIHPTNKLDVGLRLARLALSETYGCVGLIARSPSFVEMRSLGQGRIELRFRDTGFGLTTRDGLPPTEFEIAGADRQFAVARATLAGDRVVVSSDAVAEPVAVRFGWRELANPNLTNSAGLPAIPFRTDCWPVQRERAKPVADSARNALP
jgi:sialate O-acetylesterase